MTHTDGRTTTRRLTDYAKIAITRQCKQLFELGAIKVALCLTRNLGKLTLFNIMKLCKSYRINLENYFRITCELKKNKSTYMLGHFLMRNLTNDIRFRNVTNWISPISPRFDKAREI